MESPRRPAWSTHRGPFALAAVVLVLAVVAAFGGSVRNGWILLDDPEYVWKHPVVQRGLDWDSFRWCWTSVHGGNWHPLTSLSHLVDVSLFGLDTAGPHAVNVGFHALAVVLLFAALARILRSNGAACAVALVFAVHPLRVESVAWVAERKDVLSGVFFALTLLLYARWVESRTPARLALLVAAFALGLCAKSMLVTVPCVLVLLDAWPLGRVTSARSLWRYVLEKLPLFALSAISAIVTYTVQRGAGAMQTAEGIPFGERLVNAPVAVARYAGKLVWPRGLSPYYPFEHAESAWPALLCTFALALVTFLAWRSRRERPWLLVGWLWFLGMLVPVIGLVQVGGQSLADRYTYLPQIGLGLAVVQTARVACERRAGLRWAGIAVLALVASAWIVLARAQVRHWRDSRTLAEHMLDVSEGRNALAHMLLANATLATDPALAGKHFGAALALVPNLRNAHSGLALLAAGEGRWPDAEREYRAELAVRATPQAYYNLGLVLQNLGRREEALRSFEEALRLDAAFAPAHTALSAARGEQPRPARR